VDGEEFFTNCLIQVWSPVVRMIPQNRLCPVHAQYDSLRNEIGRFYQGTTLEIVGKDIEKYEDLVKL
jgi:Rrf2 family transcriptional regulator, iron-sulfur cluster assembly transcription factor